MLVGETVYIEDLTQTGLNEYREPVYEATVRPVRGVLIAVGATSDMGDTSRPDGVSVAYTLYFPKTFDESLRGKRVQVYGTWFDVIGDPQPWRNESTPTDWWLVAEVTTTRG